MPKTKIEISRQVEICRDEKVTVEVDVPAHILDDPDELFDWVEGQMNSTTGNELSNAVTAAGWDQEIPDENIEYTEVLELDDDSDN